MGDMGLDIIVNTAFYAYLSAGLIKDYVLKKRDILKPEYTDGLIKKIELAAINNKHITSLLPGIAVCLQSHFHYGEVYTPSLESSLRWIWLLYPVARATLSAGKANVLFTKAYKRLKSKHPIVRVSDFFMENPSVLAGMAGLGQFCYHVSKFDWGMKNRPLSSMSLAALLSFVPACGVYVANTFLAGLLHSSSAKLTVKNTGIMIDKLRKRPERALAKLEQMLEIPSSSEKKAEYHMKKADIYASMHKMDRALLSVKQAFEVEDKKWSLNPHEWLRNLLYIDKLRAEVRDSIDKYSTNPIARVRKSIFAFKKKNFNYALDEINKAHVLSRGEPHFRIIKAIELDAMHKHAEAEQTWADVIQDIIASGKYSFRKLSHSSKEVLDITSDRLFKDMFIFTRSNNIPVFRNEHNDTRFVYSCYDDKRKIPRPFAFIDFSNSDFPGSTRRNPFENPAYMVISRIKGTPLAKKEITMGRVLAALEAYFDFVSRTTAQRGSLRDYSAKIPVLNCDKLYREKFLDRIPCDEIIRERLWNNSAPIREFVRKQKTRLIHGNFHSDNIIEGETECLIDFGDMCIFNDTWGIEQLLSGEEMKNINKNIIYMLSHDFDDTGRSQEEFIEQCMFLSAFGAAPLLGRSIVYREGNPGHYLQNLQNSVSTLIADKVVKGADLDTIKRHREDLELLKVG